MNRTSDAKPWRSPFRFFPIGLIWLVLVIAGCGGYGEVSKQTYDFATALYPACLAKSEERVEKVEALLDDETRTDQMSEEELGWIRDIVSQAKAGKWESAAAAAKRMLKDQSK